MSDYISEHELALILRLLPVKTLLRFRCVSKPWKQLIDSPFFIQLHLPLQTPRFLIQDESHQVLVHDSDVLSLDQLNLPFRDRKLLYYGTHHGLICLYDSNPSNILVWNPSIRRLTTVHLPQTMDNSIWRYLDTDFTCFGFWIEPSTKEFKFVVLNRMDTEGGHHVGVSGIRYSSISQNWSAIPHEQVGNWVPDHQGPAVMVQGVAHWRGYNSERTTGFILAYDFVVEKFDLIQMPSINCGHSHFRWQGELALVYWKIGKLLQPCRFGMYVLKEHGLWIKVLSNNLRIPMAGIFWVSGDALRFKVVGRAVSRLMVYDSGEHVIRLITDQCPTACLKNDSYFSNDFVESLLFP